MAKTDPIGKEMLAKYKVPMPNQHASDAEIAEYIAYFKWADASIQPRGQTQPHPAVPGTAKPPGETLSAPRAPGTGQPK
jgi:hypothetical protein